MEKELRDLCVAFGRLLIALGGVEEAPSIVEPQVEGQPDEKHAKPQQRKLRTLTCVDCHREFQARTTLAKRCPACKAAIQRAKLKKFVKDYVTAAPGPQPAQDGTFDCPRMHVRIRPDFCGSRDECWNGKPCDKTAGKTRPQPKNFQF